MDCVPTLGAMTIEIVDQQKAFAEYYVLGGGNGAKAAIQAGYAPGSAKQTAYRLLGLSHVQDEIRRQQMMTVRGRLVSKALGVLEAILDDDQASAGVRLDAAKTALDRGGICAVRSPDLETFDDLPLYQKSIGELEQAVQEMAELITVAKERQRVIDADPIPAPALTDSRDR